MVEGEKIKCTWKAVFPALFHLVQFQTQWSHAETALFIAMYCLKHGIYCKFWLEKKWQLCVFSLLCIFQGYQKKNSQPFTYCTYRIAHTINFSKHSGSQRSISIHFGKMKEQQIFLENYFLSLAEAFDKRFDIGLTSNMPLSAEGQVFFFFVWRSQEKFNRETFNSVMKKEVNSAIPCLKSNRISNLINYFCSQRLSWL